jgi:hypothetical protein
MPRCRIKFVSPQLYRTNERKNKEKIAKSLLKYKKLPLYWNHGTEFEKSRRKL